MCFFLHKGGKLLSHWNAMDENLFVSVGYRMFPQIRFLKSIWPLSHMQAHPKEFSFA